MAAGEPVAMVASPTWSRAERAARFVGPAVRPATYAELARQANRVLIATSDDRITAVADLLAVGGLRDAIVLHTSGARGGEALAPLSAVGNACGALHPLLSIASPEDDPGRFEGVAFGLSGDPAAVAWAEQLVTALGGRALHLDSDRMGSYHAAAVLASNALPALIDCSARLMMEAGVDYDDAVRTMGPLARAALENTLRLGPVAAMTGPVARGDVTTIAAHRRALASAPAEIVAVYRALSIVLLDLARRRGVPHATLVALADALEWHGQMRMS
jgi:predicted short-subunit dehydrogenase-like oxidoreductase (DUF2520 family)